MSRPRIPPRYVHAPSSLVYSDLPKSIIVTGLRIWGLGWQYDYRQTAPVPLEELCDIVDLSRTQLYEHLARLVDTEILRYLNIDGEFTFLFSGGLADGTNEGAQHARAGPSPENRTDGTIHDVVDAPSFSSIRDRYEEHHERQQQQPTHVVGGECEGGGDRYGNRDNESDILDRMGIAEPTRSELLRLDWTNGYYLMQWLEWFESQDDFGPGWVITQIRAGFEPPAVEDLRAERQRYLEWGGGR